jgi:hypothetical protein
MVRIRLVEKLKERVLYADFRDSVNMDTTDFRPEQIEESEKDCPLLDYSHLFLLKRILIPRRSGINPCELCNSVRRN